MDSTLILPIVFLVGSILCFTGLFVANRFYSRSVASNLLSSFFFALCVGAINAIAFLIIALATGFSFDAASLPCAIAVAALFLLSQISGVLALSNGSMGVYSQCFMLGGMVLPFFYDVFFTENKPSYFAIAGIVVMTASLIAPLLDGLGATGKKRPWKQKLFFVICCLMAFFANGTICVLNAYHASSGLATSNYAYSFFYSLFSFAFALLGFLIAYLASKKQTRDAFLPCLKAKPIGLSLAYGLCYGFGSLFSMLAVTRIPSSILYPVCNGIVIVLTYLLCRFAFKEKGTRFGRVGLVLTVASVILFMF